MKKHLSKRPEVMSLLALLMLVACGVPMEPEQAPAPLAQATQALCNNQPQYLQNPSFQNVGPNGSSTSVTVAVPGGAGNSAAASWTLFANTPGTIRTNLQASTRPFDTTNMIHVWTNGDRNGLVQVFGAFNSGPTKIIAKAMVYVVSGKVGIGTGNGGNTGLDAVSQTTGQWELIQADNGVIPANEFIIYAANPGGAEFYVDYATVTFSPNLLSNPTFATVGPNGASTSITTVAPGGAGSSAAADWTLFTNTPGLITSQLMPSTLAGMTQMLYVATGGTGNGVLQVFGGSGSCTANGPAHTESGAWVYVLSGQVGLGTGDGGNTHYDAFSTTTNQWEWIQANNGVSPANELILYASSPFGARFYVGFARVNETP